MSIMELIFFYINQAASNFIEKQGFNFSSNYRFFVEYIEGKYVLKQEESNVQLPKDFFDEHGCITNITAVVGENGSGKTTLLTKLSNYYGSVKDKDHTPEYDNYFMERYEKDKTIAIYLEESGLVCYHNIDNFESEVGIKVCYLQQGSAELTDIVRNNRAFESISKICISNSMYAVEDGYSTHESISKISLNVNSLRTLKNTFYKKKCRKATHCAGGYYEIQDIVCSEKKANEFQQILDIIYLQYVRENNIESVFVKNIVGTLEIKFQAIIKSLKERYSDFTEEKNKELPLRKSYDAMITGLLSNFDFIQTKTDIFVNIYLNLLYELLVYRRIDEYDDETIINNKGELINYILNVISEMISEHDVNAGIFEEAIKEIQEYEQVLNNCRMYPCTLPVSDMAYISYKEIEYESEAYSQFLGLVKKSVFEREYSYVLKYIEIGGLRLASGERALLNFFSWTHFVPYFNYFSNDVVQSLHENVLLLIDEIDLYCHPLWQQKLINYLIEEVKAQYSDKKVQIIFTTHSPIVLSDMPRSNVIFLKRENARCSIDEEGIHEETFGANIYKLFDDAFFLGKKGQIGEFSRKKIQAIIDKIKPDTRDMEEVIYPTLSEEEVCLLEQQIALIGEKIIQDKLYEMLYKCKYSSLELREKKIEIYKEKIKRLQNGEDV